MLMRDSLIHTARASRRAGLSVLWTMVFIVGCLAILGGAALTVFGLPGSGGSSIADEEVRTVKRGQFVHRVTETGDIESSANVEIRCEVKARGTQGTPIIEVVPEGTMVKKDDILVQLDATAFETQKTSQEMAANKAEAAMIQARNAYETAVIAKTEYLEGTFRQEELAIESEIFVAKQNLSRAKDYLLFSKKLATKGYVTAQQLEADQFAVEKADRELQIANNKLDVLRKHTKLKKLTELQSAILTADAKKKAEENSYDLEQQNLDDINQQITKCTVRAPSDGQVVHANQRSRRGGNDIVIEPGVLIRENQVMIRLPDPSKMQVKAKINEARVDLVKPGMTATIQVGAFPDLKLTGKVEKVNRYAEPGSWFSSNVKTYATFVSVDGSPEKLRPGLTAEVQIEVSRLEDVLMLPITCIAEHGGKHYCLVRVGDRWEPKPREVLLGPSNESMVVIRETQDLKKGIREGDVVAANPLRHRDNPNIEWPELKPEDEEGQKSTPQPEKKKKPQGSKAAQFFKSMDSNEDGKLTSDEVPAEQWGFVSRADKDKDGAVSRAEFHAAMAALKAAGGGPGGGPGAGP